MKLGIVTPTLNAERYLQRCLDSIWSQPPAGLDIDHVIIDGASTDRTTDIAAAYPCRVVVASDGGMYEAVNRGLSVVTGDVLAYVNADDEVAPGALRLVAKRFAADPDIAWLCGAVDLIDADDHALATLRLVPLSQRSFVGLGWSPIHSMAVWARRAFVDAVGDFDTSFRNTADYDWYARALALKLPRLERSSLARFRLHDSNLSKDLARMAQESREVQRRYGGLSPSARMAGTALKVRLNASNPRWLMAKKSGRLKQGSLPAIRREEGIA